MSVSVFAVFVYGTLKRGECRCRLWPRRPLQVSEATVRGALYDLGPYPALVDGPDRVAGELWTFRPEDVQPVLQRLDQVEGFYPGAKRNLYERRVVECQTDDGRHTPAYCYFLADRRLLVGRRRVSPGRDGVVRWSGRDGAGQRD